MENPEKRSRGRASPASSGDDGASVDDSGRDGQGEKDTIAVDYGAALAERIQYLVKQHGRVPLATHAGFSYRMLVRYQKGTATPGGKMLAGIVQYTGCNSDWLLLGVGEPYTAPDVDAPGVLKLLSVTLEALGAANATINQATQRVTAALPAGVAESLSGSLATEAPTPASSSPLDSEMRLTFPEFQHLLRSLPPPLQKAWSDYLFGP